MPTPLQCQGHIAHEHQGHTAEGRVEQKFQHRDRIAKGYSDGKDIHWFQPVQAHSDQLQASGTFGQGLGPSFACDQGDAD